MDFDSSASAGLARKCRRSSNQGMTLTEVIVAVFILGLVTSGLLAAFIQSRTLTEGSIYQNSATTIAQGYIEQIKNMDFTELPYYAAGDVLMRGQGTTTDDIIYTRLDSDTADYLHISPGTPPALSAVTPGVTPANAVANLKTIDINDTPDSAADDLRMNIYIWVTPITDSGLAPARLITLIYSWEFNSGRVTRSFAESIRTIRSDVPTF